MGFSQAFKLAFKSLSGSKMRAFLTMLGIIIGVASVIILVSLMQGMTVEVTSMFEDMGTNTLTVSVTGRGSSRTVDADDMYELYEENSDVFSAMSPTVSVMGQVKNGTDSDSFSSTSVTGVSEQYDTIGKLSLAEGRVLSYSDLESRSKVAVVGSYLNKSVFGGRAVGQTLKINGNIITIVGALDEKDDSTAGSSDDCLYLPYTTEVDPPPVPAVPARLQADLRHDFELYLRDEGLLAQQPGHDHYREQALFGVPEQRLL